MSANPAFARFLSRPLTEASLVALGAEAALRYFEARGSFGVAIPGHLRRKWWLGMVQVSASFGSLATPTAPAMATEAGRSYQADQARHFLAEAASIHERVGVLAEAVPQAPISRTPAPSSAPSCILRFPIRGTDEQDADNQPPPAAA